MKKSRSNATLFVSSLDRNRTCIWSFGNSYTIHCTTRPANLKMNQFENLKMGEELHFQIT